MLSIIVILFITNFVQPYFRTVSKYEDPFIIYSTLLFLLSTQEKTGHAGSPQRR